MTPTSTFGSMSKLIGLLAMPTVFDSEMSMTTSSYISWFGCMPTTTTSAVGSTSTFGSMTISTFGSTVTTPVTDTPSRPASAVLKRSSGGYTPRWPARGARGGPSVLGPGLGNTKRAAAAEGPRA